ncbi:MAG: ribbon-helix-helix protein, CopG family [Actinobacteria bacterium]|nr:ribbon-helix-helix protein, CopG family [Actinomycetota bacterium]
MSSRGSALLGATVLVAGALLVAELGAGGLGYGAGTLHDPCRPRVTAGGARAEETAQRYVLRALDELACRTGKSREELVLELADRGIDVVDAIRRLEDTIDDWRERLEDILDGP